MCGAVVVTFYQADIYAIFKKLLVNAFDGICFQPNQVLTFSCLVATLGSVGY